MSAPINVTRSSLPSFEEYCAEIRPLWETRWLTNGGAKLVEFKRALGEYLDVPRVVPFSSGHLALEAILDAMELTGEVITTPFTFASTVHAIVRKGMTPVFCDIRPDDYTLDAEKIEPLITEKTSAILPVHVYGHPCDHPAIARIAEKHNLKVIYDAAQAFGVSVDGVGIGNLGDAAMFSFHATKAFHTVEGGAVCCRDEALAEKIALQRNFGFFSQDDARCPGGNAKMSEFHAAMGLCNLRHIDREIDRRAAAARRYAQRLSGVEGIHLPQARAAVRPNHGLFPVLFDGFERTRDEVFDSLKALGVFPRKYFYPIVSEMTAYRDRFDALMTPIAKRVADQVLCLPLYADLEPEDVDRVCDLILFADQDQRGGVRGCGQI